MAPDDADEALDAIGRLFEVRMAETHARARPEDLDALRALAYAYTGAGMLEQALASDLELVRRAPEEPGIRYDLACSYALLGRRDEAFEALSKAVDLGFDDPEHMTEDEDLVSLHGDPRWRDLLARVREAANR